MKNRFLLLPAALAASLACLSTHAAPRAFVSSTGIDRARATCALNQPCRTFQAAHNVVDPGGEIVALDTADYGTVTITKSVAIIGSPGAFAAIGVAAGNGVTIATAGVDVVLRNLSISGFGGTNGVLASAGHSLTIEGCVISDLAGDGIALNGVVLARILDSVMRGNGGNGAALRGGASAEVANSRFMGNGATGFYVESAANNLSSATVSDSIASGNGVHGFAAKAMSGYTHVALTRATASDNGDSGFRNEMTSFNASATMILGSSLATRNGTGVNNEFLSISVVPRLHSLGNNLVTGNTVDTVLGAYMIVPGL